MRPIFFFFLLLCSNTLYSQNPISLKMNDEQKFMEAYETLANLAKKNPLMPKLWTDAQMNLLRQAKEVYFAVKDEQANSKVQTVAYKNPNPDPTEDIPEILFVAAIQNWKSALLAELKNKGLESSRWKKTNVIDAFGNEVYPIIPELGTAINAITNDDNSKNSNTGNNGLPSADTTQEKSKYQQARHVDKILRYL